MKKNEALQDVSNLHSRSAIRDIHHHIIPKSSLALYHHPPKCPNILNSHYNTSSPSQSPSKREPRSLTVRLVMRMPGNSIIASSVVVEDAIGGRRSLRVALDFNAFEVVVNVTVIITPGLVFNAFVGIVRVPKCFDTGAESRAAVGG
jgi:hypothetical protein